MRRIIALLALAVLTLAATTPRPVNVTITKTDGATVRGQLAAADLKTVSVTLLVKGKPEGETAAVPWAEIKSISNGLTRQKVIDQWKKEHPDDRCADCRGDGKLHCATCKGTGRDAAAAKECPTCKGEQTIACNTPKCDAGKVPCPKMHVRLDQGSWFTRDGKKWRKFPGRSGALEISESHVGEMVEIQNGDPQSPRPCPLCAGSMIIEDARCHGAGMRPCNVCSVAATKEKCSDCERGKIACQTCNATGVKAELLDSPQQSH